VEKNEVDIRVIGPRSVVATADQIIRTDLAPYLVAVDSIGPSGRMRAELKPEPLNTLGLRFRNGIVGVADWARRIKDGARSSERCGDTKTACVSSEDVDLL
jgi:hypothetical protein